MVSDMSAATISVVVLTCCIASTACVPTQWKKHHEDQHADHGQQHTELRRRYGRGLFESIDQIENQYYAAQVSSVLERTRHDLKSSLAEHESALYGEATVQMLACTVEDAAAVELLKEIGRLELNLANTHRDEMEGVGSVAKERRIIVEIGSAQRQYMETFTRAQRKCWRDKREVLHIFVEELRRAGERGEEELAGKAKYLLIARERRLETDRWHPKTVEACATYSASDDAEDEMTPIGRCSTRLRDRFRRHIGELNEAFRKVLADAKGELEVKYARALTNLREVK